MIKDGSRYYIFTTGKGIPHKYSTDLPTGPTGKSSRRSARWATNAVPGYDPNNWASPRTSRSSTANYHLYYSISQWATIDSAIGLYTSPSLITPVWTDQGKVIQSRHFGPAASNPRPT